MALQWLFWQMGGLGPIAGQNHHFVQYAPEPLPYAIERYVKETARLYGVLNKHLADGRAYICGAEYSIADIACYPWVVPHERQRQNLDDFRTWQTGLRAYGRAPRPNAYALAKTINTAPVVDEASKRVLFGQDASTVR
ncbi:glutathione S-transferase C-terminal domain-containing protein [Cupriavidus basilensis]